MSEDQNYVRIGVFDLEDTADKAIQGLTDAGYDKESISVICSDETVRKQFPDVETPRPEEERHESRAVAGGATGALLGGATAAAVVTSGGLGLAVVGTFFTLAGAGAGSFIGAMTSRGVEKEVADYYDQALEDGKILVAVKENGEGAKRVFEELGAKPIKLPDR